MREPPGMPPEDPDYVHEDQEPIRKVQDDLVNKLIDTINYAHQEWDVTLADILGALEVVKWQLCHEHLVDEEER